MTDFENLLFLRKHARTRALGLPEWGVIISIILFAVAFASMNYDLPIVRNGALYAKIASNFVRENIHFWQVTSIRILSYGKPILFPLLSLPLISVFGGNTGLILTSFLCSLCFLVSCIWFFLYFNKLFSLPRAALSVELLVTFINPLMLYQFWSAYPDGLFAAFVVLSFVLLDKLLRDTEKSHLVIFFYFAVTFFSITIKYYGLILIFLHPAYLFLNRRALKYRSLSFGKKLTLLSAVVCFGCLLLLARVQLNPLLNLGSKTGGGYQEYLAGFKSLKIPLHRNIICLIVFLWLTFNASVWLVVKGFMADRRLMPFWATSLIFTLGLLIYPHMYFNIRFLIPIIPFFALAISSTLLGLKRSNMDGKILLISLSINLLLSIYFNHQATFMFFEPFNKKLSGVQQKDPGYLFGKLNADYFDSLRMREHIKMRQRFADINQHVPPGATIYIVGCNYYNDSLHGLYEQLGFIRRNIIVKYAARIDDIQPLDQDFYLFLWKKDFIPQTVFNRHTKKLKMSLYKVVSRNSRN